MVEKKINYLFEKYLAFTDPLVGAHQSVPGRVGDFADSFNIRFQTLVSLVWTIYKWKRNRETWGQLQRFWGSVATFINSPKHSSRGFWASENGVHHLRIRNLPWLFMGSSKVALWDPVKTAQWLVFGVRTLIRVLLQRHPWWLHSCRCRHSTRYRPCSTRFPLVSCARSPFH